jgi:hypothetical protein
MRIFQHDLLISGCFLFSIDDASEYTSVTTACPKNVQVNQLFFDGVVLLHESCAHRQLATRPSAGALRWNQNYFYITFHGLREPDFSSISVSFTELQ